MYNNQKNEIYKKLTSLTLMAIMVAGGMTFAVPGMVPEAYAANANLFVSAENSKFDNYMSGPQVIEVAIIDSSISDTDEGKGEPDVTVNGNNLRMVQATDGNWYGYFADRDMAIAADTGNGMDFGTQVTDLSSTSIDTAIGLTEFEADGLFYNEDDNAGDSNVNVVREPKNVNMRTGSSNDVGQIGIDEDAWPFIQLYTLSAGGNVVIQYNKGGGAQSTTLTFDTVDDYAGIELDRSSYPQGAQVHATITDAWLNIDPTDEDSWTFNTVSGDAFYHVYNDNGGIGENTSLEDDGTGLQSVSVGDLMCSDCALKLDPNVQGDDKHVITIQGNADSRIINDNATAPASTADAWVIPDTVIRALNEGTQPVTITEQGPNSGIFGTYDESDDSLLRILDNAARGTSATLDYNDSPVSVLVTHAFATIDIQPASDVWNSGELIPVVLVDADINKNTRADEDISLSDPNHKIIPSLRTGSPITLGSGDISVSYNGGNMSDTSVDAFSDRAILTSGAGDAVNTVLIDLGITAGELQASLLNTNSTDANYGYNLLNYDIRSLVEEGGAPNGVDISLVYGTEIAVDNAQINLVCDAEDNGIALLDDADCANSPRFNTITPTTATVNQAYSLTVTATDPTNDDLTYTVSNGTITQAGVFTFTPKSTGSVDITFTVTDSTGLTDTETVTITVREAPQAPNAPTGVIAQARNTAVDLSWTAPTGDDLATGYKVQYRLASATSWTDGPTPTGTSVTITGLTNDQAYQFRVIATNNVGDSTPSSIDETIPSDDVTAPNKVTGLTATAGDGQVSLSWTIPHDGNSAIIAYTVQHSTDAGNTFTVPLTVTITGTEATVGGLTNGEVYIFIVSATNVIGTGPTSDRVSAIPQAPSNGGSTPVSTSIVIPLLYDSGSAYEMQHFGTAFDKAVSDFNVPSSKTFSSQKLDLETTPIQSVLDADARGAVGTYTSEQLRKLNDTGKIGTGVGDIVLLSYSSAAQSFAKSGDGIFRLTTDTSRQVSSIVTELIPIADFDNVISIHLNDAWSQDYVAALAATYGANHKTITYDSSLTGAALTAEFASVLSHATTGLSGLDAETAIVILEYDHDRLDALVTELARTGAYAGISTTKFIIPDVPSGAFGNTISTDALTLLKATDMQTIKFALSENTVGQTALKNTLLAQNPNNEVNLDGTELFDRHAYSAYDAGQILTRAINALPTGYTTAQLNNQITATAEAYSSNALIYNTKLNGDGDLECMVYDIFEIDDTSSTFELQDPTQETTDATNCPIETPSNGGSSNTAPVLAAIGDKTIQVGTSLSFTLSAQDADDDRVSYNTSPTLTGATLGGYSQTGNKTMATFTWTPTVADTYDVTFTAMDTNGGTDSEDITITVNTPPVITPITSPQSATVDQEFTLTVEARDADNDRITYTSPRPQDVTSNPTINQATGVFRWTPVEADIGDKVFTFTANDGKGPVSVQVTITVSAAATPVVYPPRVAFDAGFVDIPILYHDIVDGYEKQFANAFDNAIDEYQAANTNADIIFAPWSYNITTGTTADIDPIVTREDKAVVGTYTSEQLAKYKDDSRVVFLSYASTASTLSLDDNIFRLTMDNKRQTAEVLKPQLDAAGITNVITIHRNDEWSSDFVDQLNDTYHPNHDTIPYNSEASNVNAEIMTQLQDATVLDTAIAANTAIVILGFEEASYVIMELAMNSTDDVRDYTGIDDTKIFIPDLSFDSATLNDAEINLLKNTDMKTIKFALKDNATTRSALNTALYSDPADVDERHVYAAYDAGQILVRAIDELGKNGTVEQLKTKIPEVARAYSDDALIHSTVLGANGDLECTTYDVLEIDAGATPNSFTYKTAIPVDTCASTSSVPMLNSPQLVSCIDCAINSFGEIFGQTVQVHDTDDTHIHDTIGKIFGIDKDMKVGLLLEYSSTVTADSEADPIVLDFFSFGFGDDGRTANQIVRLELEETGDNTDTFIGGLEYTMLNQLNILDASTYTGLSPISDEPTFIVMEDLTDEDSPRVNYLDLGADGVATQIADQQEAPSHSGVVALDSDNYKVADTVIITLTDADLNVDSDLIDIFTVVKDGDLADTVGKDVSSDYGRTIIESGAPLGRVLDVTFDDQTWTVNSCGMNDIDNGLHETGFTLIETDTASGVFTGSFQIPTEYCRTDAKLVDGKYVRESVTGTDIEVNYLDYRDASGEIIEVGDSAGVRASTGSVSLDRTVYPVPFGENTFNLHASAGNNQYLDEGAVSIHVRVSDPDYDISASGEDVIAEGATGPIEVTVSRGSDKVVVATAGGESVIEATNTTAKEYGPITEIAPDAGIFEADITISSTDGPYTRECPDSNGCVLQGDIITVQYNDPTDASGDANTITDSATFDLRNAVLQSDKSVYIIGSDMILTLIEPDFDLDSDGAETYSLDLIEWDSDAATTSMGTRGGDNAAAFDPEPNAFRETGDSTGIFQVVVEIPEALSGDKLERGEEIELEYTDWGPSGSNYVGEEDEDISLTVFTSNFGSTVELDQKVYTWTDKVYITIVAPDHNFDSDLVDEIGNSDDDPIRIATRSADLDNYKLVETGTDTGIFTGEVILTGFAHDANGDGETDDSNPRTGDGTGIIKGLGPTNGFLETEDDDGLSVSFEFSEDETVIGSSLIRWNIGEVQWLEASYAASGTGLVRVVDPDMNLNPESVDNFEIDIWSDTHAGGIDLTVTETNQATGIFEGTVFFTVTDESSGHRLRVSEGDTVTAEYADRTLPDPHDTTDKIDISATTQIGSLIPPLERAPATNLRVVDAFSNTLDTISVDSQVQITADLANGQDKDQPFAYIVQIQDSSSVTVALAWVSGTLTPSQSFSPALSWTPSEAGTYTATAFVWESVDNPTALSPPNELTITVN